MSRRRRAIGFLLGAFFAAAAAATIADGYGQSVVRGYGELRPVLVASADLPAGKEIDPAVATEMLEVRRVPVRFAPAAALAAPQEALGLVPTATVPAGSYLLAAQLRPPRLAGPGREPRQRAAPGRDRRQRRRRAGAPTAASRSARGSTSSSPPNPRVRATAVPTWPPPAVPLLALTPGGTGESGEATVTLGLTRPQALRLIAAESFARRVTVIPG